MQAMEETGNELMHHLQRNPFFSASKQHHRHLTAPLPAHPSSNASQTNAPCPNFGAEGAKLAGIPPASPYSQLLSPAPRSPPLPPAAAKQSPPAGVLHSRSRSQPAFFSLDCLPPMNYCADSSPTTSISDSVSADVSMDDLDVPSSRCSPPLPHRNNAAATAFLASARDGLPPRKAHRRSRSEIPFAFLPSSLPLQPAAAAPAEDGFLDSAKMTTGGLKVESYWDRELDADGVTSDDLFAAYMNLDGFDGLNSSDENREDLNSRDSGSKTNAADTSENEADSNMEASRKKGMKRNTAADPAQIVATSRHCRSLSMDSFMGKFNFEEEPPKPLTSPALRPGNSVDAAPSTFSLEFGNSQFTAAEMKKIMENEKLVEMAMADPKRVKRILANRQSAARSKERKTRYIAELEHKLQILQTETTTLSAQLTFLQRDSNGLKNQNNELKFRFQAMEQQAQLRDALNEALTAEVQRLKLAATGLGDSLPSSSLNPQKYQLQQQKQQTPNVPLYQLEKQENTAAMDSRSEH
ncbi:transcription factor RF2a-like [Canna indica]|uniref:Transcription factor RF2a-like n=1 Tax=Canna indica TaxID=4628 RepID=A0AAQ3QJ32_9LILI|nr:transcription factor RF2a-like [Canna indica]